MLRRFIIAEGDNSPVTTRVTITPTTAAGTQIVTAVFPVSWAIVVGGGDTASSVVRGPFYINPSDSSSPYRYDVSVISGIGSDTFVAGSLQVFMNGQLLDNGTHYSEFSNTEFDLLVGAGRLEEPPLADNSKGYISYNSGVVLTIGETVLGASSGASGLLVGQTDSSGVGEIEILGISGGVFANGETITGQTSGGTVQSTSSFFQGGDRLAVVYRPENAFSVSGVEVYVSQLYPTIAQGFQITYTGATPATPFSVDIAYQ